jgi:hypothetical protein
VNSEEYFMNAHFHPLSGRTEFQHTYILTTDIQSQTQSTPLLSDSPLIRLQRGRLATKEVIEPYFAGEKTLIGHTVRDLRGESITPWIQVIDAKLILMSSKATRIALKRIFRQLEWEKWFDYLQECRKKLRENLQQFYLRIKEKQEESQRVQLKNETLSH